MPWQSLHPGVAEWVRLKNGEPLLFPDRSKMPAEWSAVFEYCLRSERAEQNGDDTDKLIAMMARKTALFDAQARSSCYE